MTATVRMRATYAAWVLSDESQEDRNVTTTDTIADTVERIITAACERRLPAELLFIDSDGVVVTGCVRVLDHTPDLIITDEPLYLADDGTIPTGRTVTAHMSIKGERYQFETVIVEKHESIDAGTGTRQLGIALRKPIVIAKSQRRSHLRILTIGYDPIDVGIATPAAGLPSACSLDAPRGNGWMVDLSAGGLSVVVDRRIFAPGNRGDRFFMNFRLPGHTRGFNMLGSVRHSRPVSSGVSLRVAMSFCKWGVGPIRNEQRRIARFVADHERRMLRRRE